MQNFSAGDSIDSGFLQRSGGVRGIQEDECFQGIPFPELVVRLIMTIRMERG